MWAKRSTVHSSAPRCTGWQTGKPSGSYLRQPHATPPPTPNPAPRPYLLKASPCDRRRQAACAHTAQQRLAGAAKLSPVGSCCAQRQVGVLHAPLSAGGVGKGDRPILAQHATGQRHRHCCAGMIASHHDSADVRVLRQNKPRSEVSKQRQGESVEVHMPQGAAVGADRPVPAHACSTPCLCPHTSAVPPRLRHCRCAGCHPSLPRTCSA